MHSTTLVRVSLLTLRRSISKVPVGSFAGGNVTYSDLSDALLVRVSLHRVYASISKVQVGSFVGGDENPID